MLRSVLVRGILALGLFTCAAAAQDQASAPRRIVIFKESVSKSQRVSMAQASGAGVVRELPLINAVVIETPEGRVEAAEATLQSMSGVVRIEDDPLINWLEATDAPGVDFALPSTKALTDSARRLRQSAAPQDPRAEWEWPWRWHWPWPREANPQPQQIPWGISRVGAPPVWSGDRGQNTRVVVIDTGIDRKHPDLSDNVKGGWNVISRNEDFNDDNGHGSHCSGTVAARDDSWGVVGVAPQIDLYGVKVLDEKGRGTIDNVIAGMQWAVDNKMEVASMSLGSSKDYPALGDAVEAMRKAGVILVAAAGNASGGPVGYPGAYPGAIAVAASASDDTLASFSSRGPQVAVIAPGKDVYSTYKSGAYKTLSGTSMATPHVAGLMALYVSTHKGATPEQARTALVNASTKLPNVPDDGQGAGLPDAAKLIQQ